MQPFLGHIVLYALVAVAMPAGIVALALLLTRVLRLGRGAARSANDTYESGMVPIGDAWIRHRVQYYLYALVFVIFDVEVIFFYPLAAAFRRLADQLGGPVVMGELGLFAAILLLGLAYAWRRGALRWV